MINLTHKIQTVGQNEELITKEFFQIIRRTTTQNKFKWHAQKVRNLIHRARQARTILLEHSTKSRKEHQTQQLSTNKWAVGCNRPRSKQLMQSTFSQNLIINLPSNTSSQPIGRKSMRFGFKARTKDQKTG